MQPIPLHHVWTYTDVDRRFWAEHLEDWLPETIFDAHTHIADPGLRLVAMTEEKRRQYWVNEVSEPIAAAQAGRCCGIVFPGRRVKCLAMGFPSLEYDVEASNDYVQRECQRLGWPCLMMLRPRYSSEQAAELLDRPGVVGVKPYYGMIGYNPATRDEHLEASIFDFLPHATLDVLNRRRAWVTLHVPRADRLGHPANIAEIRQIRRQYPDVILVIAHLGRCYTLPHAEEALPQLADDSGLYFDISAVLNGDVLRFALRTLGPDRILYGTDNPVFYMRGRRQWFGRTYVNRTSHPFFFNQDREPPEVEAGYTLYMYEALRSLRRACEDLGLTRRNVEKILRGNAERLLAPAFP